MIYKGGRGGEGGSLLTHSLFNEFLLLVTIISVDVLIRVDIFTAGNFSIILREKFGFFFLKLTKCLPERI